jgi:curved DNA-binding protein CbpA
MKNTHYDSLHVSRTASLEVIRAAYKSLAHKYHPDKNHGDAEATRIMQLINHAYEILSDPIKKAEYDKLIEVQEALNNKSFYQDNKAQEKTNTKNEKLPEDIKERPWRAYLLNGIGAFFILGILGTVVFYTYENIAIRNQKITVLEGLRLGLRPVDVTLYAGQPNNFSEKPKESEEGDYFTLNWSFIGESDYVFNKKNVYHVDFWGENIESLKVNRICSNKISSLDVRGLPYLEYTNEHELIDKLGQPTHISIDKSGISKLLSYPRMNVSFEITQSKITLVCISKDGVSYAEEYQEGEF